MLERDKESINMMYKYKIKIKIKYKYDVMIDHIYLNQILQNREQLQAFVASRHRLRHHCVTANFLVLVAYSLMLSVWRLQRQNRKKSLFSSTCLKILDNVKFNALHVPISVMYVCRHELKLSYKI